MRKPITTEEDIELVKELINRIKVIQNELKLSNIELARELDMQGMGNWYYKGTTPRIDKLIRLVEKYPVNPGFLLKGEGHPLLENGEDKPNGALSRLKRLEKEINRTIKRLKNGQIQGG